MTLATIEPSCVILMREGYGHRGSGKREGIQIVAVVTGVFVESHLAVRLDNMALVAVYAEAEVLRMGKLSLLVHRKFLVRVTLEAWQ